jgi:carboxypeptidase Taq
MKKKLDDYDAVHALSRQSHVLYGISHLLEWDQETYMPPAASPFRAEQLKTLAGIIHKDRTSKKFEKALSKLIDLETGNHLDHSLPPEKKRAVELWRKDYLKSKALPTKFVEDFAKLSSQAMEAWRHARKENSFSQFAPFLDKVVVMNRRKAKLLGYKDHPYDALLDLYEPDITTKDIDPLFADLRQSITGILTKIKSKKQVETSFLKGNSSDEKQLEFGKKLLEKMGYDMQKGRLDQSTHPFSTSSHPTDSRITTRIHQDNVISNICVVLHEGGHSLYEMGFPEDQFGSPLAEPVSLGVHESQSRWWETRIGHSKPFWQYYLPELQKHFGGQLEKVNLDQFYKGINQVNPSLIRVEADEVTYNLHVILRYEIEKGLIEGSLNVRDVPAAWNAKMQELLGVTPESNDKGCLQDIHWSMGAMGYFPTYTLGNLYSSHLFQGFENKHPDWKERVSKDGELKFIREWLHDNVYKHGRRYTSKELLKNATGKDFSAKAFTDYLENKYSQIYHY